MVHRMAYLHACREAVENQPAGPLLEEFNQSRMAQQVFYRKWRPQRFTDVVGQEYVTQTLGNALSTGRIAHAFLFCGPRGTGKTSSARILAMNRASPISPSNVNTSSVCVYPPL